MRLHKNVHRVLRHYGLMQGHFKHISFDARCVNPGPAAGTSPKEDYKRIRKGDKVCISISRDTPKHNSDRPEGYQGTISWTHHKAELGEMMPGGTSEDLKLADGAISRGLMGGLRIRAPHGEFIAGEMTQFERGKATKEKV